MLGVTCNMQYNSHSDAVHVISWCAGQQHWELGPTKKFID